MKILVSVAICLAVVIAVVKGKSCAGDSNPDGSSVQVGNPVNNGKCEREAIRITCLTCITLFQYDMSVRTLMRIYAAHTTAIFTSSMPVMAGSTTTGVGMGLRGMILSSTQSVLADQMFLEELELGKNNL